MLNYGNSYRYSAKTSFTIVYILFFGYACYFSNATPFEQIDIQALRKFIRERVTLLSMNYNSLTDVESSFNTPNRCQDADQNRTKINILMMGDSINRYMVDDICLKPALLRTWGKHFSYVGNPAYVCESDSFTFGYLNIYGSSPIGPYHKNHVNTPQDPYADTNLRIRNGLTQYIESFGIPEFIVFRVDLWDMHLHQDQDLDPGALFSQFLHDNVIAYDLIRSISPTSILGTHTIPTPLWGLHLFHRYENGLRYLSDIANLVLFDWNLLLSSHQNKTSYLRLGDPHHPNVAYSNSFANLMIFSLREWYCINPSNKSSHNNSLTADEEWLKFSTIKKRVHNITYDNVLMRPEKEKQVYYVKDKQKYPIKNAEAFESRGWKFEDVIVATDILEFENIPNGSPII
mmetsp:Transcript_18397/g.17709  ORF Transcript_18397/g.17709 Transcript_18397/m.17709 type:complete len:402 (+) Transcript_18397:228-1433(+)